MFELRISDKSKHTPVRLSMVWKKLTNETLFTKLIVIQNAFPKKSTIVCKSRLAIANNSRFLLKKHSEDNPFEGIVCDVWICSCPHSDTSQGWIPSSEALQMTRPLYGIAMGIEGTLLFISPYHYEKLLVPFQVLQHLSTFLEPVSCQNPALWLVNSQEVFIIPMLQMIVDLQTHINIFLIKKKVIGHSEVDDQLWPFFQPLFSFSLEKHFWEFEGRPSSVT